MSSYDVLGVDIHDIDIGGVIQAVSKAISKNEKLHIATVNNEFVIESRKNKRFADILKTKTLNVCDSIGVKWAVHRIYNKKIDRVPGVDMVEGLLSHSKESNFRFFLLGGRAGVGRSAKENILKKYPGANIAGIIDSIKIDPSIQNSKIISKINNSKANIVLVALGAPNQELWINKNLPEICANVFIGVGGTLDFISGRAKRAPSYFRKLGLEWLWRLVINPSRIIRVARAVIIFPTLVLLNKNTLD